MRAKSNPCDKMDRRRAILSAYAHTNASLYGCLPHRPASLRERSPAWRILRGRPCGGTACQRAHNHLPRHQASLRERHRPSSPAPASVPLRKYTALTPPAVAFLRERAPGRRLARLVRLSPRGNAAHRRPSRASLAPPQRPCANVPAASVSHACVSPLRTHSLSVPPTQVQRTPSVLASPAPAGVPA